MDLMAQSHRVRLISRRRMLAAALIGLPTIGGLLWSRRGASDDWGAPGRAARGHHRHERRPTLDPARFTGKTALAHRVAREIPDVIDELRCYCGCELNAGHVSLLSCYVDGHAVT
jgi:hypothetical protein